MHPDFPTDFHPAIIKWFRDKFGEPTEPQKQGWPLISSGTNTLILAPTGSGKTLAAFLAGINRVFCDLESGSLTGKGVEILYISPLKALNYDIERNLSNPLREIQETARAMGCTLPEITTAVRTGDTPTKERRRMITKPPHILITTPESLHLILTSAAAKVLETVRYVIVDEIHAISTNKRGVFLSILLERMESICNSSPTRIGLSATQKPLSEVASFLGGFNDSGNARQVSIVDTGVRRQVDLKVVCTCDDLRHPDEGSVWPSIFKRCLDLVRFHKSTIIFANTRRIVEKLTMGINELAGEEIVRPHHGSVSAPMRRRTEEALKNGTLKGVVATGTLELGIDMGAVELVCQVESPKEVSRGLQRVGRAGHVHTAVSKGRILAKTNPDLAEAVSVAKGMLEGDVEPINVPKNCLDVLAQQIVAMAALSDTTWADVYNTVKRTYSFNQLSEEAFNLTLQLVSGRYPSKAFRDLRPRVSFDRITGRISPLPGAQRLVINNGGAIPDTGQYGVYLSEANLKIGELDEEFVYESREGDTFSLGTNNWKILKIDTDRVLVSHGNPFQARMPFWKGENVPRSARAGRRMGELLRQLSDQGEEASDWAQENLPVDIKAAENLVNFINIQSGLTEGSGLPTDKRIVLESFCDEIGSKRLALLSVFGGRIHQALRIALSALIKKELGVMPETISGDNGVLFKLPDGDTPPPFGILRMLTPELAYDLITEDLPNTSLFGLRFRQNAARALLLPGAGPGKRTPLWLQRMKAKDLLAIAKQFDGFPIVVETFRECLQDYLELDELQEILRQIQTGEIEVSVVERQIPSQLTSTMLFDFQMIYQYEWDNPKSTSKRKAGPNERRLVDELVDGKVGRMLDERAISDLDDMRQGIGDRYRARTAEELYELARRLGDIPEDDIEQRTADPEFIHALLTEGRLVKVTLPNAQRPIHLVACDHLEEYVQAASGDLEAINNILDRHIYNRGVICPTEVAASYGFSFELLQALIDKLATSGELVEIIPLCDAANTVSSERSAVSSKDDNSDESPSDPASAACSAAQSEATDAMAPSPPSPIPQHPTPTRRYVSPDNLEIIYRRTLAFQRLEAKPASAQKYSEFLTRWQHLHPDHMLTGLDGVRACLGQLEALWLPFSVWETDILSRRIKDFKTELVDNLCLSAEIVWTGQSQDPDKPGNVAFLARQGVAALSPLLHSTKPETGVTRERDMVVQCLKDRGASFLIDLVADTRLDSRIVQRILWEMIWSGEVTHDYFKLLRSGKPPEVVKSQIVGENPRESAVNFQSSHRDYYRSRSRIAKSFTRSPSGNPGRWMLLSSLTRNEIDVQESLEILARVLLERYGIVAKDLVQRTGEPDVLWGDLYEVYQRMELSGEIERGYFVDGLAGAQFGLPDAVDELMDRYHKSSSRIFNPSPDARQQSPILINVCDPAYLWSAVGPFDGDFGRLNRLPSNYAVLLDGQPVITIELGAKRLSIRQGISQNDIETSITALPHLVDHPWPIRPYRKVEIASLDSDPIIGSPVEGALRRAGFERESEKLVLWGVR